MGIVNDFVGNLRFGDAQTQKGWIPLKYNFVGEERGEGGGQMLFNNQYLSRPRFDFQNWYIYNELYLPSQSVYAKPDCQTVISCVFFVCLCFCSVSFLFC